MGSTSASARSRSTVPRQASARASRPASRSTSTTASPSPSRRSLTTRSLAPYPPALGATRRLGASTVPAQVYVLRVGWRLAVPARAYCATRRLLAACGTERGMCYVHRCAARCSGPLSTTSASATTGSEPATGLRRRYEASGTDRTYAGTSHYDWTNFMSRGLLTVGVIAGALRYLPMCCLGDARYCRRVWDILRDWRY